MIKTLVFSNDDAGIWKNEERAVSWFQDLIKYLNSHQIKGTFFWIPRDRSVGWIEGYKRSKWMDALRWAIDSGHDIQLHLGFCYTLRYYPKDEEERRKFKNLSTIDRLKDAIEVYRKAFNNDPLIFRAHGDLMAERVPKYDIPGVDEEMLSDYQRSKPNLRYFELLRPDREKLYKALLQVGIHYISELLHSGDQLNFPIELPSGIINYPFIDEFTPRQVWWDGTPTEQSFDDFFNAAKQELDRILNEGGVCTMNSHWHVMHKNWEQTKRFYDKLFKYLKNRGCCFKTFKEVLEK